MSKMSELDLIIRGQTEPIHKRLLQAQKDIKALNNAMYAEHRLVTKLHEHINALNKMVETLTKQMQDNDK